MAVTPNFSWPTPDDTDQLSAGAAAIRTLGSAIDARVYTQSTAIATAIAEIDLNTAAVAARVPLAGGTMTGKLRAPTVELDITSAGSDTIALNFSDGNAYVSRSVGGTAVTITGSGYGAGQTKTVRIVGGTAVASLSVPAGWTFVGTAAGTSIGTATTAVITATAFGTAATDVVAGFAESV